MVKTLTVKEYFFRQLSNERAKISREISQISWNDRDRCTELRHLCVEQAINTSSGIGFDMITQMLLSPYFPFWNNMINVIIPI